MLDMSKKEQKWRITRIAIRLLGFLKPYWGLAFLFVLLQAGFRALHLVNPWVEGQLLDRVFGQKDADYLYILVCLWIGVVLSTYIMGLATTYLNVKITGQTHRDLQILVYKHLRFLPFRFYDNHTTGQIMAYINSDTGAATSGVFASGRIILAGIEFVITLTVLSMVNPWLGVYSIPFTLLVVVLPVLFRGPVKNAAKQVLYEKEIITSRLQEGIAGSREIKALGHEMQDMGIIQRSIETLLKTQLRQTLTDSLTQLGPLASLLGNPIFFLIGGIMVLDGHISVGYLWMANRYLNLLVVPLYNARNEYQNLLKAGEGAKRVFTFFDENRTETNEGIDVNIQGKVRFEKVHFGYDHTTEVLKNISFEVSPGQLVALIGPSGAGKSTILNLIPRFYETTKGTIYVDDHDITTFKLQNFRSHIGTVFQSPYLFSGTIDDNIRLGAQYPEKVKTEDIIAAATAANAHNFIMKLKDGYATEIGERGVKLSGGERQRIAIARVLIRNPRILILDEAISALDSETEQVVTEALERLMKDRTSFVIAHRLSTVQNADVILSVENGQIVEQGTHHELLNQNGIYARIYHLQFAISNDSK